MPSNSTYRSVCKASPETAVLGMLSATWMARSIYYAVKTGTFERIAAGSATSAHTLAPALGATPESLYRLLKGLEHLELLAEMPDHEFQLTALGRTLLPGARGRLAAMALLWGEEFHAAWSALPEAMATNRTAFEVAFGEPLFPYLARRTDTAARFNEAMQGIAELLYPELALALDWGSTSHVMDVGGGSGRLLATLLDAHPHLTGTLFDLPHVIDDAVALETNVQLGNRLTLYRGDFFEEVPRHADCLILANILHDWTDDRAAQILSNCRRALGPESRLILVEMALDNAQEPLLARSTDLNMLTLTGGRERSLDEFRALLHQAGCELESVTNIQNMTCALIARPAG
jgi:SAM-dependent methyltransferase